MRWIELQGPDFFVRGEYRSFPMPILEDSPEYSDSKPSEIPGQITKIKDLKQGETYQVITTTMPGVAFTLLQIWTDDKGVVRIETEQLGKIPSRNPLRYGRWSTAELGITANQDGKWNVKNRLVPYPHKWTKETLRRLIK